jgi:hypothetical protein
MHKGKKFEMSHEGFFLLGAQNESIFWEFFLGCSFLKIIQMPPTLSLL